MEGHSDIEIVEWVPIGLDELLLESYECGVGIRWHVMLLGGFGKRRQVRKIRRQMWF